MIDLVLALTVGAWALTPPYDASSVMLGFGAGCFFQEWWVSVIRARRQS